MVPSGKSRDWEQYMTRSSLRSIWINPSISEKSFSRSWNSLFRSTFISFFIKKINSTHKSSNGTMTQTIRMLMLVSSRDEICLLISSLGISTTVYQSLMVNGEKHRMKSLPRIRASVWRAVPAWRLERMSSAFPRLSSCASSWKMVEQSQDSVCFASRRIKAPVLSTTNTR